MPLWGKGSSDKPKYLISGAPNHDPEDCFATEEGWILRHYKGYDKNTAPYWDEVLVAINGIDLGSGGGGGGGIVGPTVNMLVYTTNSVSSFRLKSTGTVEYEVDWGDGTVESLTVNEPNHSYSTAGQYTVTVTPAAGSTYQPYF